MNRYFSIIKADYLQRFRSYTFIISLIVSVLIAYSFAPTENANYTTISVGQYVGFNNAAWIGHITAIMASTFLWLIGFYLINNGIRRDKETGVGQIIATTAVTNFQYLLSKSFSNFLVLLTITAIIFLMALGLVIIRGNNYEFNISQFLLPYLFTTLPSLFFLSAFTILLEVIFGSRTNLLNVTFFFLFAATIAITNANSNINLQWLDPLGIKFLTNEILSFVKVLSSEPNLNISVGFNLHTANEVKHFLYEGSHFSVTYILSRLLWVLMAFVVLKLSAILFNRFDTKVAATTKKKILSTIQLENETKVDRIKTEIIKVETNFGIYPLIKTEFIMLLRKGPKWFWIVNASIFILLFLVPLDVALKRGLPIFWFLQINRWADLSTKEIFFGTDTFIYSTYKPLQRLLVSQILAGIILAILLAMPVLISLIFNSQFLKIPEVILGAVILVSCAVCSGIVWRGKRFFEIVLFMTTYFSIQGAYFLDYWGGNYSSINYIAFQILIILFLISTSFLTRQYIIKQK